MVTVISRFRVRNGLEEQVRRAFLNRPHLVENAPGFCGLNVLTDSADPSVFLLVTRWLNEESFRSWHRSESHHESHILIPKGLKLDPSFTSVTIWRSIQDCAGVQSLNDAIEIQTGAFSQWLQDSDAIFAVLLSPEGAIRARNRAGMRAFPPGSAGDSNLKLWDYLVDADSENLRRRLLEPESLSDGSFLLNLAEGERDPVTWETQLLRCNGAFVLLGSQNHDYDSRFQTETLQLTNDLSNAMREAAQKNRELQKANETIELLVRTDALTGLANRRMLEETLPREIARARRLKESLSVVFLDVDHFKSVNDKFGHSAGDQVLARLGAVLQSGLRSYVLAARFGGDEFVLLLPGSAKEDAITVAERTRERVATLMVPECPSHITVSLGVASLETGESGEKLVARADEALYRAKQKGRNRVEVT